MQVDGVRILREVDEAPDLGVIQLDDFSDRIAPVLAIEKHDHCFSVVTVELIQRHHTAALGVAFLDSNDRAQL